MDEKGCCCIWYHSVYVSWEVCQGLGDDSWAVRLGRRVVAGRKGLKARNGFAHKRYLFGMFLFIKSNKIVILRACDFFDFSVFLHTQSDGFQPPTRPSILSEAPSRDLSPNRGFYRRVVEGPRGILVGPMLFTAFRPPKTMRENQKSQPLGMTKRRGLLKGKGPLPMDRAVDGAVGENDIPHQYRQAAFCAKSKRSLKFLCLCVA